jgi:hypothetical protein
MAKKKPLKWKIPEWARASRYSEKTIRPHALAIGQLALAWNDLHEQMGMIFLILIKADIHSGGPIWNSHNFDRPKRMLLRAAVENVPLTPKLARLPKLMEEVLWIINRADSLEDTRNDAIHAPLVVLRKPHVLALYSGNRDSMVIPDAFLRNTRAAKLREKNLLAEFRWCRNCALILRDYAIAIYTALDPPVARFPWPDRPSLPNRPPKSLLKSQKPSRKK